MKEVFFFYPGIYKKTAPLKEGDVLLIYYSTFSGGLVVAKNVADPGEVDIDRYSFRVKSLKQKEELDDALVSGDYYPPAY